MDKKQLRQKIRQQKREMTEQQIQSASEKLGELFAENPLYRQAKTIYGYLPYNQEVRTVPMLQRALDEGKRVAVPKCYGDEMRFIYLEDLSQVEKGYCGIPEPIRDEPVADDPTALLLRKRESALAMAAVFMINFWHRNPTILPWRCATASKWWTRSQQKNLTSL